MKKVLFVLSLIVLLLWGVWQLLAWTGAQRTMNKLAGEWSDQGDLRWEGLRPSPGGSVTVQGLRWYWFDITEPVTVESVELETPGPLALLRGLWLGRWPGTASLRVRALEVQLKPNLFRPWALVRPPQLMGQVPLALHACGNRRVLSPTDLLHMGIDRIALDLSVTQSPGQLALSLDAGDLGRVQGQMAVQWQDWQQWLSPDKDLSLPRAGDLMIHDSGFMRRLSNYCAAHEDKILEDWKALSQSRWRDAMAAAGMVPTDSLAEFYGDWLTEGGTLRVQWQQDPDVDLLQQQDVSAGDWLQAQGLVLHHNGQAVDRPAVALVRPDEPEPVPAIQPRDPSLEPVARFHVSELERAAAWIDRRVRVTLRSGRTLEGRLLSRDEETLHIHQIRDGGEVIQPLALDKIERFEVWRRDDDPGRPLPLNNEPLPSPGLAPWLERIEPIPAP
ncbi:MAG: hypothetical protein R3296_01705 [Oleiphilaceae bacterium]|nr:hypothetical protein [Oleiphilaceae bacterium]